MINMEDNNKQQTTKKVHEKKDYMPPLISLNFIEMEGSFLAASAVIIATDVNSQITSEWNTGTDVTEDLSW